MAEGDKPYRLYRGGRKKGKSPTRSATRQTTQPARAPGSGATAPPSLGLWAVLAVVGLLSSPSSGASSATGRSRVAWTRPTTGFPRNAKAQLAKRDRSAALRADDDPRRSAPTAGARRAREDANRSDSLMLLHLDPGTHRISYLSIPRDLRVEIPGYGSSKINAANQLGGPALTLATVKALTGLPIDHVVVVDFDGFKELIDAIGGIEVNVPKPILSNRFDCPYKPARCANWEGWRFDKGKQHMDGRRALVYSRIRDEPARPVGHGHHARQPAADRRRCRRATRSRASARSSACRSWETRSPRRSRPTSRPGSSHSSAGCGSARRGSLRCRLGGEPSSLGGESVLLGSEDNVAVISMWLGRSAPLPPPKGTLYGAGCTRR